MGAAISYCLAVGLLTNNKILPPGTRIKVVAFGSPRVGDQAFSSFWKKLVDEYRSSHGLDSFQEYSVRAYNDGESDRVVARRLKSISRKQGFPCCHLRRLDMSIIPRTPYFSAMTGCSKYPTARKNADRSIYRPLKAHHLPFTPKVDITTTTGESWRSWRGGWTL